MLSGQIAKRSRDEVAEAIRQFTPADWARLRKVAAQFARGRPIEAVDLLQEACLAACNNRLCPNHVGVVKFVAEAIRSIAHGEGEKVIHKVPLVAVGDGSPHQAEMWAFEDPAQNAEALMVSHANAVAIRDRMLALFDDDPVGRDIMEGVMEELTGEELRELTGLEQTAYDSKRRLLRRRIDKAFPEGWKP